MALSQSRFSNEPPVLVYYYKSDRRLEVQSLTDKTTDLPVTGATVTAVVKDEAGSPVTGIDNPLTLSHVASGTYRAILPDTASATVTDRWTAEITADDGANRKKTWIRVITVEYA